MIIDASDNNNQGRNANNSDIGDDEQFEINPVESAASNNNLLPIEIIQQENKSSRSEPERQNEHRMLGDSVEGSS